MKFVKILKYIENSFEDKPSFLIEMDKGEYISSGCVFVENNPENRAFLIKKYKCETALNALLDSDFDGDMSSIKNARGMFYGCSKLTEFTSDMSSAADARGMFCGCSNLTKFASDMSSATDTSFMFYGCSKLTKFDGDMSSVVRAFKMFYGCSKLAFFDGDIRSVVRVIDLDPCPTVDWEFIATDYNHIATDKDGTVWTYAQKPVRGKRAWEPQGRGKFRRLVRDACGYISNNCHWKDSLISRPGVKK